MILKQILGLIGELTPVVGDVIENVKSQEGGVGRFFTPRFIKQVTRLIIACAAIYLFASGKIGIAELQEFTK